MTRAPTDQQTLARLRAAHAKVPAGWTYEYDEARAFLTARDPVDGSPDRLAEFITVDLDAAQYVAAAHFHIGFLLGLVDRAASKVRDLQAKLDAGEAGEKPAKDYGAQCAIACGKRAFQKFLAERHGLGEMTQAAAGQCVRNALGIKSRSLLNSDPTAMEAWRTMDREFTDWLKQPQN